MIALAIVCVLLILVIAGMAGSRHGWRADAEEWRRIAYSNLDEINGLSEYKKLYVARDKAVAKLRSDVARLSEERDTYGQTVLDLHAELNLREGAWMENANRLGLDLRDAQRRAEECEALLSQLVDASTDAIQEQLDAIVRIVESKATA